MYVCICRKIYMYIFIEHKIYTLAFVYIKLIFFLLKCIVCICLFSFFRHLSCCFVCSQYFGKLHRIMRRNALKWIYTTQTH